jgi:RNA polymerase sigma factor (sigma-70 family)
MNDSDNLYAVGRFDARYLAFLETIATLRPSLHRYCARMTGSVSEGEDVVQESLFHAYRKLDTYDDQRPLKAWLFRIAHNRCIDVLRRREVREGTEAAAGAAGPVVVDPVEPLGPALGRAVGHLGTQSFISTSLETASHASPTTDIVRGSLPRSTDSCCWNHSHSNRTT